MRLLHLRVPALLTVLAALLFGSRAAPALWHSPHDVINACALSPDFETDRTLFVGAGRFKVLLRSTDGGRSFEPVNAGLSTGQVRRIAISPGFGRDRTLFCAETDELFRSTDAGDEWTLLDTPEGLRGFNSLVITDAGTLLANGGQGGLWRSEDLGDSWSPVEAPGLRRLRGSTDGARLAALTREGGLLISEDDGRSFREVPVGPARHAATLLLGEQPDEYWLGTAGRGVFVTRDAGRSWTSLNDGLSDLSVQHLALSRGADGVPLLFAATREAGVFLRVGERPWRLLDTGMREKSDQTDTHYYGVHVTPRMSVRGGAYVAAFEGLHRLDGKRWTHLDTLPGSLVRNLALSPALANDKRFWISTYGGGVLATEDLGRSFARIDTQEFVHPDGIAMAHDGTLAMGKPGALLLSDDAGATWVNRRSTRRGFPRVIGFAPDYAETGLVLVYASITDMGGWHGFHRSTDRGLSWEPVGPAQVFALAFAEDFETSGRLWAGARAGVWVSEDRGATWELLQAFPRELVGSLSVRRVDGRDEMLVALEALGSTRVMRSADGGSSWTACTEGLDLHYVQSVAFAGESLAFAGTRSRGVLVSVDGGESWAPSGEGPRSVFSFAVSPTYERDGTLVVGSYHGVWVSEDAGASWRLAPAEVR